MSAKRAEFAFQTESVIESPKSSERSAGVGEKESPCHDAVSFFDVNPSARIPAPTNCLETEGRRTSTCIDLTMLVVRKCDA